MNNKTYFTLFLLLVMTLFSCTTQKKKGDVSKLGKFYHNTTAHYNGYFNADILLQESMDQLSANYQDNYNKILPIYTYSATENPGPVVANLDESIKKVSRVVSLHRPSVYTDDCYLILGKSQFLKQEYEEAEKTLLYTMNEFSPAKLARMNASTKKKSSASKKKRPSTKKAKKRPSSTSKKKSSASKKRKSSSSKKKKKKRGKPGSKKRPEKKKEEVVENKTDDKTTGTSEKSITTPSKKPQVSTVALEEEPKVNKGDGTIFEHKPAYQEVQLWYARTLMERRKYEEAARVLNRLNTNPGTYKEIKIESALATAHLYLTQSKYGQVIEPLKSAISLKKNKEEKARYTFILGQVYEQLGDHANAFKSYDAVIDLKPEYELDFNARLKKLQSAAIGRNMSPSEIIADLEKMAKDEKNEEYRDQIYYTIAQIYLDSNDREMAKNSLKTALRNKSGNKALEAETYYLLANLEYEDEHFHKAKYYYDSTMMVMSKSDERFGSSQKRSINLKEIAENVEIVIQQDSLLALSELSEEDLKSLAKEILKEEAKKQALKTQNTKSKTSPNPRSATNLTARSGNVESSFFAYNERSLKKGKKDFDRTWGDRILVDDWRRVPISSSGEFVDSNDGGSFNREVSKSDINKIFAGVPKNETEKNAANRKIEEALYNLGGLYRDKLDNYIKSVKSLDKLFERFPKTDKELNAWYLLYLDHTDLGNKNKARYYLEQILEKYPESTYAKVLMDPNFLAKAKDEQQLLDAFYKLTYTEFINGNYQVVFDRCNQSVEKFGSKNTLNAKFAMLKAMSQGQLEGKETYIKSLEDLIARYPGTAEETRAKEILRFLSGDKNAMNVNSSKTTDTSKFKLEDKKLHYVLISLSNYSDESLKETKLAVSSFNKKYHQLKRLKISEIIINPENKEPIILVRKFNTKDLAMKYLKSIQDNKADFIGGQISYDILAATQRNYREIVISKSLDSYKEFFAEHYMK